MGGSWDATNVVTPSVCTVTRSASTTPAIWARPSPRWRPTRPGSSPPRSRWCQPCRTRPPPRCSGARAAEVGATLRIADRDFRVVGSDVAVGGQLLDIEGVYGSYADIFLPLHGGTWPPTPHWPWRRPRSSSEDALDPELVVEGLGDVGSPGRLEVLRRSPTVVADGAHNPMGMRSLVASLPEAFPFGRVIAVVAVLADKDAGRCSPSCAKSPTASWSRPTPRHGRCRQRNWPSWRACTGTTGGGRLPRHLRGAGCRDRARGRRHGVDGRGGDRFLTTVADARMLLGRE